MNSEKTSEWSLTVDDLNVWYGSASAVREVNFTVTPGKAVALIGRNGAGKSSIIRGLMNSGVRSTGRVSLIDGHAKTDLSSVRPSRIARSGLAWVPDDRRLFPSLTVGEMLRLAARTCRVDGSHEVNVEVALEAVPFVRDLMDRNATELSGGQQQLVAIARALAMRPKVLLLDEPSEGLAPVVVDEILQVLLSLKNEHIGIVLSEQNTRFALQLADTVIGLVSGDIRWTKSVQECAEDTGLVESVIVL